MPVLNSVTPSAGPPGTAIACQGSGFDAGARVACPALVDTTFISATEVRAFVPELAGQAGEALVVFVYVQNADGSRTDSLPFTLLLPANRLQTWTTIEAVCEEVPGFKRGGRIPDQAIENWMRGTAQSVAAAMVRRGISLRAADWQQADGTTGMPQPAAVLESINRLGAAARLASAIGSDFTHGEWALARELAKSFEREVKTLEEGGYDKLFRPTAATAETGPQVAANTFEEKQAFGKTKTF
jgi:IPT/TIG domain